MKKNVKALFDRILNRRERRKEELKDKEKYIFGGCRDRNTQAIYFPQWKKLKGYQKQKC